MRRMPWGAPVHYGVDDVAGNRKKCKRADEYQRARMDISSHNEVGVNVYSYLNDVHRATRRSRAACGYQRGM